MSNNKHCRKCQRAMERGFTPDFSYGAILLGSWVEGEPAKGLLGNLKLKGRRKNDIVFYRCTGCGFLETYAPEP